MSNTTTRLHINVPFREMIRTLEQGGSVWGGGVGLRKTKSGNGYVMTHPDNEGGKVTRYFKLAGNAIGAYLAQVNGNVVVTLEPDPA